MLRRIYLTSMFSRIIILGTGNAQAINCYNTCFALKKENEYLLVDAGGGNGILRILNDKSISLSSIHNAVITHAHTDHIIGMVWIYRMIAADMKSGKYRGTFNIYCHDKSKETLVAMIKLMLPLKLAVYIDNGINFIVVDDGDSVDIMGERFTFFDIRSTKEKQYGFYFETPRGRFVCLGDEPCAEHEKDIIRKAYFVMHEAFCLYEDRYTFKPYEKHHSTAKEAAQLAKESGVSNLLLYHTEDKTLSSRKERYSAEAAEYFNGNIFVPDDGEEIPI